MASYNSATFIGNLARDPEERQAGDKDVVSFKMAVNARFRKDAEPTWVSVDVWGKSGESCMKYLEKGSTVCVRGEISLRTFEGRDGGSKTVLQLNADEVTFLSAAKGGGKDRDRDDGDRGRGRDREERSDRDRDRKRNEDRRPSKDSPADDDIPF